MLKQDSLMFSHKAKQLNRMIQVAMPSQVSIAIRVWLSALKEIYFKQKFKAAKKLTLEILI